MEGDSAESDPVQVERRGSLLLVTIDRPHVRNAVNAAVAAGVKAAIDLLEADPLLRVGILTGAGGHFCAGADLGARSRGERVVDEDGLCGLTRRRRRKPLVAAVEGYAVGGGLELVLACDMAVASVDARFALPEVKRVVMAAEGGLIRSVATLGRAVAMELALTGEPMSSEQAWMHGLVNRVVPTGEALGAALELAERVARNSPAAVEETLIALNEVATASEEEAWKIVADAYRRVRHTPDHREGVQAFLERREPRWPSLEPARDPEEGLPAPPTTI